MECKNFVRNQALAIISFFVIYFIFFHWLDIPITEWSQQTFLGTIPFMISQKISVIFATKNWIIVAVIAGVIGLFFKAKKLDLARSWLWFSSSVIVAYIACFILKVILARYRPEEFFSNNLYGFHFVSMQDNFNSSPSGHAATAFAGLYSLALILNKRICAIVLLIIAILIGFSRIVMLAHYMSDVIFGSYLGVLSVYWCKCLVSKITG